MFVQEYLRWLLQILWVTAGEGEAQTLGFWSLLVGKKGCWPLYLTVALPLFGRLAPIPELHLQSKVIFNTTLSQSFKRPWQTKEVTHIDILRQVEPMTLSTHIFPRKHQQETWAVYQGQHLRQHNIISSDVCAKAKYDCLVLRAHIQADRRTGSVCIAQSWIAQSWN